MDSAPGVSVVIPTYNREHMLPEALDSVLAQDWPSLDVVVVENGSTDGTADLLAGYTERHRQLLRVIHLRPNQGPSVARNAGILAARHEHVAFLDSDNRWLPGKLERQMRLFGDDPGLDVAFTGYATFGGVVPRDILLEHWPTSREGALEELLAGCCINTSSVVVRRTCFARVGLFDPGRDGIEDYELWLRMAIRGVRMAYLADPLTAYRVHPEALSGDLGGASVLTERLFQDLFSGGRLPVAFQEDKRFYLARTYLNSALRYLAVGHGQASLRALVQAVVTRPASIRPGWLAIAGKALPSALARGGAPARPQGRVVESWMTDAR